MPPLALPSCLPLRRLLSIAALLCLPAASMAQPAGAQGDDFLYRVQQGDTLIGLAQHYTGANNNWTSLQSLNQIADPQRLPIGKVLHIPFRLIPVRDGQAVVAHVSGQVLVDGKPAARDLQVPEGSTIQTGANGFATLRLEDGSLLTIPSGSRVVLDRVRVFTRAGLSDAILNVDQGSLESQVAPEGKGVGRFEVRTPVSITGVRGTRLRVHATAQGASSEVLSGAAHVDGSQQQQGTRLQPNQGVAVNAQGQLSGVRTLLPAPQLQAPERSGGGWLIQFPAITGAQGYLVRVANDAQGTQPLSSQRVTEPSVVVHASGPDTHYVLVRALDADGLGGTDAMASFPGQQGLTSSDGSPILSGHGLPIQLTVF